MAKKKNLLTAALGVLSPAGVNELFDEKENEYVNADVSIADIVVLPQFRMVFETEDHTLENLAADIRAHGVTNPITLRLVDNNVFHLVAGERRLRAATLAGLSVIPARYRAMTDDEFFLIQISENFQRLDLPFVAEGAIIDHMLKSGKYGSVEAIAAAINRPIAWVSKRKGLGELPPETVRLVASKATSDIEVVNTAKTIEKRSPEKAREYVNKVISGKGKVDARALGRDIKNELKGSNSKAENKSASEILDHVFSLLPELSTDEIMNEIGDGQETVSIHLKSIYIDGKATENAESSIINGLRLKKYGVFGSKCFELSAYLQGATDKPFDLVKIIESVRK